MKKFTKTLQLKLGCILSPPYSEIMSMRIKSKILLSEIALIVFIIAYYAYLIYCRADYLIYWSLIIGIIANLFYMVIQIERIAKNKGAHVIHGVGIFLIFLTFASLLMLCITYTNPYAYGLDGYITLGESKLLYRHPEYIFNPPTTVYGCLFKEFELPLGLIFQIILTLVTDIPCYLILKWFSYILNILSFSIYFLLARRIVSQISNSSIENSYPTVMFVLLPYIFNNMIIVYGDGYHLQKYGQLFFYLIVFLTELSLSKELASKLRINFVLFICLFASLLWHHITAIVIVMYLFVRGIVEYIIGRSFIDNNCISNAKQIFYIMFVGIVLFISLELITIGPLSVLARGIQLVYMLLSMNLQSNMYHVTRPTVPLYLIIFYYGLLGTLAAFGIVILLTNLKDYTLGIKIRSFTMSSLIFSAILYITAIIMRVASITDILNRMQLFADILIVLSVGLIYKISHLNLKKIIVLLFFMYILVNTIGIPPDFYDINFNYYPYKLYLNNQELSTSSYAIAKLNGNFDNLVLGNIFGDHYISTSFLYHGVVIIENREIFFRFPKINCKSNCYLIFNEIDLDHLFVRVGVSPNYNPIPRAKYYEYNFYLLKVYNNGNVSIYTH